MDDTFVACLGTILSRSGVDSPLPETLRVGRGEKVKGSKSQGGQVDVNVDSGEAEAQPCHSRDVTKPSQHGLRQSRKRVNRDLHPRRSHLRCFAKYMIQDHLARPADGFHSPMMVHRNTDTSAEIRRFRLFARVGPLPPNKHWRITS
jgi:hypothetical protein